MVFDGGAVDVAEVPGGVATAGVDTDPVGSGTAVADGRQRADAVVGDRAVDGCRVGEAHADLDHVVPPVQREGQCLVVRLVPQPYRPELGAGHDDREAVAAGGVFG
ncbi:hypothetical protein ACWCXH_33055 [Kitasatospora sp. NPDC001660]